MTDTEFRLPVLPRVKVWSYETPLEQPPEGVTLDPRVIEINGVKWQARSDCVYKNDYYAAVKKIQWINSLSTAQLRAFHKKDPKNKLINELNIYRNLMQSDLFFFVYFAMKNVLANHPFIVEACKEIESENGDSVEVWARDHLKTTIISTGRQCQKVLNDPERRIGIFSATRPLAVKIQGLIRELFESKFLVQCFPDILYDNPTRDAPSWSASPEGGLTVRRKGFYKEATISSWGLLEGTPTGSHFTDLVFDDVVTIDYLAPDVVQKIKDSIDMAENLGTRDRQITIVGTYYIHDDPLQYVAGKVDPETGEKIFKLREKPATVGAEFHGASVFLPEATLAKKRAGKLYFFYCQQLLNPTPKGTEKLDPSMLIVVKKGQVPEGLYKFMIIDGSGDKARRVDRPADAWAMVVVGVEPYRSGELGMSRVYILDLLIKEMSLADAQQAAVAMYCRNGRILKLGVEKVGMSTTEVHICNALRAKRRFVSEEHGNLQILKPGGREKKYRIESAVSLPLLNGKVHILDTIPQEYSARFRKEMEKFPSWNKDDGLDAFSFVYDIIKDYRFGALPGEAQKESPYDAAFRKAREGGGVKGWVAAG